MLCFAFFVVLCLYSSLSDARKCRLQPRQQHVLSISSGPSTDATSPSTTTPTARPSSTPPSTSISISSSGSAPTPPPRSFVYGTDKIRGVNLGGWLVLEPWITPSVFERTGNDDIIDEYTLGQLLDRPSAESLLKRHWETWITEDDFVQIKAAGLNHVRIPIGYWSIPITSSDTRQNTSPAPYIPGAWPYLLRALSWAKKHGINTIIDLHGAPGSQNGYDNSGQRTGDPVWGQNPANVSRTVDTLRVLAREAGSQIDVIELLNEAAGFRGETWQTSIRQFWLDAYDAVRNVAGEDIKVMIGDAFMGVNSWQNFLSPPRGHGVMMDFHEYQIFSDLELDRSLDEHLQFTCGYMQSIPPFSSNHLWTINGEWSNAITDCAKWLNGRGVGARWDGSYAPGWQYHGNCEGYTGSYAAFSNSYKQFLRKYWEVQVELGEAAQGWVFWTWKAENADEWSYQKGLEGGWIPRDPTDRKHPNMCS